MFLCKISFSPSSNAPLPFSILKENKTLYLESANGRCSVKKMFFFFTPPGCGHWLTCFVRKAYSHKRVLFFSDYFTRDENGRSSLSKTCSYSSTIYQCRTGSLCRIFNNSTEHLKTAGNYRQLFVKDRKEKCHFLSKQAKTSKEYHVIPVKYVNL